MKGVNQNCLCIMFLSLSCPQVLQSLENLLLPNQVTEVKRLCYKSLHHFKRPHIFKIIMCNVIYETYLEIKPRQFFLFIGMASCSVNLHEQAITITERHCFSFTFPVVIIFLMSMLFLQITGHCQTLSFRKKDPVKILSFCNVYMFTW